MNAPLLQLSSLSLVLLALVTGMPPLAIASCPTPTGQSNPAVASIQESIQGANAEDYLPENAGLPERRSGGGTR